MEISRAIQNTLRPSDDNFSVMFNMGKIEIHWYALFVLSGFFIAIIIVCYRAKTFYKIPYDFILYFAILVVPVSLFGARFWSACIGDLAWSNFFSLSGGLAIQGGVVFGSLAAFIYFPLALKNPKYHIRVEEEKTVYICKPSMWIILDTSLLTILLGQAIGRWGNFFNGEIYGREVSPENLQWLKTLMPGVFDKMQCVQGEGYTLTEGLINGSYYEPLFLYESIANIILFSIVYFVVPQIKQIKIGVIGFSYLVIYGIIRFSLEPIRNAVFNFTGTYILNGLLLVFGILGMIFCQFFIYKYRKEKILFKFYCKYLRIIYIKFLKAIKSEKVNKYLDNDYKLTNYGCKKTEDFKRKDTEMLYYANK